MPMALFNVVPNPKILLAILMAFSLPVFGAKRPDCGPDLRAQAATAAVSEAEYAAPFEQYLRWSEQANSEEWRESVEFFALQAAQVGAGRVSILQGNGVPDDVLSQLGIGGGQILVPQHPYNTSPTVAFFDEPRVRELRARFLASRTLAVWQQGQLPFAIKLGTDHAHRGTKETAKLDVRHDILLGMRRTEMIQSTDGALGFPAKHIKILPESLAVTDLRDENKGYLIRDLTPILDGFYYLPAFAIPYVGAEIAARHGQDFASFWEKNYAAALGRAKAELLLRYRIHYDQANAQNIALQLDGNMMPTGIFVFHDLGDTSVVDFLVPMAVRSRLLELDYKLGKSPARRLNPDWHNSRWQMEKAGVEQGIFSKWERAHNEAFKQEISDSLGGLPPLGRPQGVLPMGIPMGTDFRTEISNLEQYLNSAEGQRKLNAAYPFVYKP